MEQSRSSNRNLKEGRSVTVKKFVLIPLVIILTVGLAVSACKPGEEATEEIRLGYSAPLTGVSSGMAIGGAFGLQAAIDDINEQGGVYVAEYGKKLPVRLILRDNESDPTKAGTLAEELVVRDKVHLLTQGGGPQMLITPICTVADRYKVPYIGSMTIKEQYIGQRNAADPPWEYTWAISFAIVMPFPEGSYWDKPGYTLADTIGLFLSDVIGRTNGKAGCYATDNVDGRGWYDLFPAMAEAIGFEVHGDLFPEGTTDFSSLISDWIENDCELLMGNAVGPTQGTLFRQMYTMGFEPKVNFAAQGALFYEDIAAWGGNLPLGVIAEAFWRETFDPEVCPGIGGTTPMSLYERWHEETGDPLNQAIPWGYVSGQVLFDTIERAGTLDADAINEAAAETDIDSITGHIVFDKENHIACYPMNLGQWQKTDQGEWVCPIVYTFSDYAGEVADLLFPIPYD